MNTILESLHSRKSVRVFIDREISPKESSRFSLLPPRPPQQGTNKCTPFWISQTGG